MNILQGESGNELIDRRALRLEQRSLASDRISETVRYIGFAVLGAMFFVLTADNGPARELATAQKPFLITSGFLSCMAILMDYTNRLN